MIPTPRAVLVILAAAAVACRPPAGGAAHGDGHARHWSYDGERGPSAWGRLDPAYALCASGTRQSPIDLGASPHDTVASTVRVAWRPTPARVASNGHTVQATFDTPAGTLTRLANEYSLLQVHYHRPSEHVVNGRTAELELHFVHRAASGELAVLGVLFDRGDASDPIVDALVRAAAAPRQETLDPAAALPRDRTHWAYDGSLTTPPCSEGVRWMVLTARGSVTAAQLAALDGVARPNARPAMPMGARGAEIAVERSP